MHIETLVCEHCKSTLEQPAQKCKSCGFPNGGTDVQKEIFYHQLEAKKELIKDLHNRLYNARVTLWIIAGLSLLFGIINYYIIRESDGAVILLIVNSVMAVVYLLLASYALDKPFTALILAAAVYVAFLLYWTIEGISIGGLGWIGRVVIIVLLIRGAIGARDAEELKKEIK